MKGFNITQQSKLLTLLKEKQKLKQKKNKLDLEIADINSKIGSIIGTVFDDNDGQSKTICLMDDPCNKIKIYREVPTASIKLMEIFNKKILKLVPKEIPQWQKSNEDLLDMKEIKPLIKFGADFI